MNVYERQRGERVGGWLNPLEGLMVFGILQNAFRLKGEAAELIAILRGPECPIVGVKVSAIGQWNGNLVRFVPYKDPLRRVGKIIRLSVNDILPGAAGSIREANIKLANALSNQGKRN